MRIESRPGLRQSYREWWQQEGILREKDEEKSGSEERKVLSECG